MTRTTKQDQINIKTIIGLGLAVVVLYIFIPQLASFKSSLTTLRRADFALTGISIIFLLVSYILAASIYQIISTRRLIFTQTLLIQTASGFTNRLAPAGGGALATNVEYLLKSGYTLASAGALAALNNILGFIGNLILLTTVFVFHGGQLRLVNQPHISHLKIPLVLVVMLSVIVIALIARKFRIKAQNLIKKTLSELIKSLKRPNKIVAALMVSILLTSCLATVFYFTTIAVNVHIALVQMFFVFTIGIVGATVTPTPGGLGGAEASLVLAFTSIGVSPQQALAATLTYRFVSYWLPILPGVVCFQICRQKRLI